MKTPFKTSRSLLRTFATLALLGPIGSALGSDSSDDLDSMDVFSTLPSDIIKAIALKVDFPTLLDMRKTSLNCHGILSDKGFQEDYRNIIHSHILQLFGGDYSAQFNDLFLKRPLYTFERHVVSLMAPDNLDLLKANHQSLMNFILTPNFFTGHKMELTKHFAIASCASQFFTETMGRFSRSPILNAFAPLTVDGIFDFAQVFTQEKHHFLTEDMGDSDLSQLIKTLAPLTLERISALGQVFNQNLPLTKDMDDSGQVAIVGALGLLSVEQLSVASYLYALLIKEVDKTSLFMMFEYLAPLSATRLAEISESIKGMEDQSIDDTFQWLSEELSMSL